MRVHAPSTASASIHAALVALIVLFTASHAAAQATPLDPAVAIAADTQAIDLGAGNETTFIATVTNAGPIDGTATVSASGAAGWTVSVDPATPVSIPAGESRDFTITLLAPAAGEGVAEGSLGLLARIQDQSGRAATASTDVGITRVDPPVVVPPSGPSPAQIAGGVGVALVVLGAAVVGIQRRRERERREAEEAARKASEEAARLAAEARARAEREAYLARETGVTITSAEGPHPIGAARDTFFRLTLENTTDRPRVALVRVAECPEGWRAGLALNRYELKPRERAGVTLHVHPDDAIPVGTDARIVVAAKPEEAIELEETLTLDVSAGAWRGPVAGVSLTPTSHTRTPLSKSDQVPRP